MSRYRLAPTPEQERALAGHCAHARYVWNLACEQHAWWRPGRGAAPGYVEQARQLTDIKGITRTAKGTLERPGRRIAQKAGLNRGILTAGWGRLVERLDHKAPRRVIKIDPAYTSQTCSACGIRDATARESQAVFACRSCGYTGHADVNAARNIKLQAQHAWTAAGRAVAAREGPGLPGPANREPQHLLQSA